MKICIVGCGAIGSLFAAHLARLDGVEVWAYDLAADHVDAINASGLRLSGESDLISYPQATTDASQIPACEYGIVATKSMHTRPAIEAVAHAFVDGAVCSVQNGVGNEEIIAEHLLLKFFLFFLSHFPQYPSILGTPKELPPPNIISFVCILN